MKILSNKEFEELMNERKQDTEIIDKKDKLLKTLVLENAELKEKN